MTKTLNENQLKTLEAIQTAFQNMGYAGFAADCVRCREVDSRADFYKLLAVCAKACRREGQREFADKLTRASWTL